MTDQLRPRCHIFFKKICCIWFQTIWKWIRFDVNITQCVNYTVYWQCFLLAVSCARHILYCVYKMFISVFGGNWITCSELSSDFSQSWPVPPHPDGDQLMDTTRCAWAAISRTALRRLCLQKPPQDGRTSLSKAYRKTGQNNSHPVISHQESNTATGAGWWEEQNTKQVRTGAGVKFTRNPFHSLSNLRNDLLQSRQSSWGLSLSCLKLQQTLERFWSTQVGIQTRDLKCFTAGTFTSVLTPAMQRSPLSLKTSHWRLFSKLQHLV